MPVTEAAAGAESLGYVRAIVGFRFLGFASAFGSCIPPAGQEGKLHLSFGAVVFGLPAWLLLASLAFLF